MPGMRCCSRVFGQTGIEYEARRPSEIAGVRATQRLFERVRTELT